MITHAMCILNAAHPGIYLREDQGAEDEKQTPQPGKEDYLNRVNPRLAISRRILKRISRWRDQLNLADTT